MGLEIVERSIDLKEACEQLDEKAPGTKSLRVSSLNLVSYEVEF
jgi:hypothetical protein